MDGSRVLARCGADGLVCLNTVDGRENWRRPKSHNAGLWLGHEEIVAVIEEDWATLMFVVVDPATGVERRRDRTDIGMSVWCDETRSYVGRGSRREGGIRTSKIGRVDVRAALRAMWVVESGSAGGGSAGGKPSEDRFDAHVASTDQRIFVQRGDTILGLAAETGFEQWAASLTSLGGGADFGKWRPMVSDNRLIVTTASGATVAFDVDRGRQLWWVPDAGARIVYGERLYMLGQQGTYLILDKDGNKLLEVPLVERIRAKWGLTASDLNTHLAVSETHVFFGDASGRVYAIGRDTGEPVWSHRPEDTTGFLGAMPVIAAGRLFISSFSMDPKRPPRLYCYEPTSG